MPFGRTSHIPEEDLSALLDGQLRGDAKARAGEHCRACSECRAALDDLSAVRSSLRELPREQARRSFAVREGDVRPRRPSLLVRTMPMLSGATVVALVAFMALVGVDLSGGGGPNRSSHEFSSAASKGGAGVLSAPGATLSGRSNAAQDQPASPVPPAFDSNNREAADGATEAPAPEPAAGPTDSGSGDNDNDIGLRVAEGVAAALALAGGGLVLAAWRRTR